MLIGKANIQGCEGFLWCFPQRYCSQYKSRVCAIWLCECAHLPDL